MKLFDFPAAPNPRRVRIFIAEKGIDVAAEVIDVRSGANLTPGFLAKNPFGGLLPVLELDDGSYLSESVAICRHLEARHPDPPLMGVGAMDAAVVEMWNRRAEWELFRYVGEFFRHTVPFFADKFVQRSEVAQDVRRLALERLGCFDEALSDRPFLAGERFTIADITAWVSIDVGIPTAFEIPAELAHLRRWFDEVSARPSIRA